MSDPVRPDLLRLLACICPDRAVLRQAADGSLVCTSCGTAFPVRDGVPVLLESAAVPGPNGIGRGPAGPA